jgi:hypothetical protein
MAHARNSSTLEATADESRRGYRASRRSAGDRSMRWRPSLRRVRRALDSSVRLIDSSRRFLRVSEGCAARRPDHASRQLERAAYWLTKAERRVWGAAKDLRNAADDAGYSPECERETAHRRFADATERWLSSTAEVKALYDRLDKTSSLLLVTFDLPGLDHDSRQKAAAPRLITGRLLLEIRLPRESGRIRLICIRRQRSRSAAFAEAARRVFRGRAPPHAAICSL